MAFPDPCPPEHWPSSAFEVEGLEFDWFARDQEGQLAVLTSAGKGCIPKRVFAGSVEAYNGFVAAIASRAISQAVLVSKESGRFHDWREYAEHGLFAYDFQDVHRSSAKERGGYDLIFRPSVPATILDLPEHVMTCLPVLDVAFGASDLIPMSSMHGLDTPHA